MLYKLGTLSHIIRSLSAANMRQDSGGAAGGGSALGGSRESMVRVVAAFAEDSRCGPPALGTRHSARVVAAFAEDSRCGPL